VTLWLAGNCLIGRAVVLRDRASAMPAGGEGGPRPCGVGCVALSARPPGALPPGAPAGSRRQRSDVTRIPSFG
jgi:hypothetical protein